MFFHMQENEKEWYSLKEIEKITGISVPSLSRYADEFKYYIKDRKSGNKRLVHIESIPLLKKIKSYYSDHLNTAQIHEKLKETPVIIDVKDEKDVITIQAEMMDELKSMKELFQQEIQQLKESIVAQQTYIDERMNERDKLLMESLRMMQEQKKAIVEVSTAIEDVKERKKDDSSHERTNKKWWKFW